MKDANINDFLTEDDKMSLSFPTYEDVNDSFSLKEDVKVNPYEEFAYFCADEYIPKFGNKGIQFGTLLSYDTESIRSLIISILGDFCDEMDATVDKDKITLTREGKRICDVYVARGAKSVTNFNFGVIANGTLRIDFNGTDVLNYLIKEDRVANVYVFSNVVENNTLSVDIFLSIIMGLFHFGDFMKFHKINTIKVNNVGAYLQAECLEDKFSTINIVYHYADADVVYTEAVGDGKNKEMMNKAYVRVRYADYVNDIDEFLNRFPNIKKN